MIFKHKHRWVTTHINRYNIPTRQTCKCSLMREVTTKKFKNDPPLTYRWYYSNDTYSDPLPFGKGCWNEFFIWDAIKEPILIGGSGILILIILGTLLLGTLNIL